MSDATSKSTFRLALVSVFLVSFSVLAFEVALTRVFSVMLSYAFVFAIVSAAMLGLGVGGMLFRRWGEARRDAAPWFGALFYSLSLAVSVVLILTLPIYASQTDAPAPGSGEQHRFRRPRSVDAGSRQVHDLPSKSSRRLQIGRLL
jgi:hypothetical protein